MLGSIEKLLQVQDRDRGRMWQRVRQAHTGWLEVKEEEITGQLQGATRRQQDAVACGSTWLATTGTRAKGNQG